MLITVLRQLQKAIRIGLSSSKTIEDYRALLETLDKHLDKLAKAEITNTTEGEKKHE